MNNIQPQPDKTKVVMGTIAKNPVTSAIAKAMIVAIATICCR